jgi:hypothetical protein
MAEILSHINKWSKEAKCGNTLSDELFFGPTRIHNIEGKKFCTGCPVMAQCRTYALVHDLVGIWGGTSSQDRENLGPVVKEFLIQVYIEFDLYDHFLTLVATGHEEGQQPEQQSELYSPIEEIVPVWDPTLNLAS